MPKRGNFPSHSVVGGIEGKVCGICSEWMPLTQFYKRTTGGYHYDCKSCRRARDAERAQPRLRNHGLVPFAPSVRNALEELINRVGKAEAARLCGWTKAMVSGYVHHPPRHVQKETAAMIFETLIEVRETGIVLSRGSIHHGSFERGHEVKPPMNGKEYYKPNGDLAAEYKRRSRARIHQESK
jgi:hypothetical protein